MKLVAKLAACVLAAGAAVLPASPAQALPGNCSHGYVTPSKTTSWATCTTGNGRFAALAHCTDGYYYGGPWKYVGTGYSYATCPSDTVINGHNMYTED
ncbi:hypothetical protein [Cryptosporangium arvum]|uniref:Uncharacterized protein n=1 Tax=Cryptosporangium arvum DSM 44712 TaxID=927661 RepID=A0A010Z4P9_9ACTN|nr:hypothetical protein [Cryptosporangium arvum]EXG82323.1 hypothetical protein CryarDRAFT_3493 [Cryptosporangium arvum DSM 44712]